MEVVNMRAGLRLTRSGKRKPGDWHMCGGTGV